MEYSPTECTVTGALWFVLLVSSICGLSPLSFQKVPDGWKIKASRAANVYGIILIVVFSVGGTISFARSVMIRTFHTKTTSDRVVGVATLLLILPVSLVAAFTGMERMNQLIHCLSQLEESLHAIKYSYDFLSPDTIIYLPKNSPVMIQRLILLYCSLCDVVRIVAKSHGVLLVQMLLVFLMYLVIAPYHLITRLFNTSTSELYSALLQFAWVVFHFSNLVVTVEPCHRTHEEMENTKNLVSKLIRLTPSGEHELTFKLQQFYRHLILNDVTYSPLRMFTLSRGLIMTILGSITTYLVVLLSL
ncbi:gustatory receptor for sugar taste 43a-like [Anticarsia gemmatalis]|uniref:gustatory receptor for sugar taste 43a-like n=1 Tax=Anticarsia gemmatalis TaxID=129554 RepID=UPI003F76B6E9